MAKKFEVKKLNVDVDIKLYRSIKKIAPANVFFRKNTRKMNNSKLVSWLMEEQLRRVNNEEDDR